MKTCLTALAASLALLTLMPAGHAAPAGPLKYHRLQSISLPGDGGWDYLTLDPDARRLYVTHATRVLVLNCDTLKIVGQIADTNGVHGVALAPTLGRGYASDGKSNRVTVFDLQTLKTLGTIAVGERPDSVVYEPTTHRVFHIQWWQQQRHGH